MLWSALLGLAVLFAQPTGEWYTWLPSTGTDVDSLGVFRTEGSRLQILDIPATSAFQEFGYIATRREYSNYHLKLRYRWGDKRFAPRALEKRDSGILYHVVGPDVIWPRSVECQIQESDTGDIFLIDGTGATTTVKSSAGEPQFAEDGLGYQQIDGRIIKASTVDFLSEWNSVEVIVTGSESVHIVNGTLVARLSGMTQPDPSDPTRRVPLSAGRILLQAEGAEVTYEDVGVQEFTDLLVPPPPGAVALTEGELVINPGSGDVRIGEPVQDFRMHVEFLVPPTPPGTPEQDRGNSGIYLQERYEIQVLDSFGAQLSDTNDAAAIYGLKDADINASRPAGTWQSYDITFRAARWSAATKIENARVSLAWNGAVAHNDVELPGPTPGGIEEHPTPARILLQDHGHPVRYRNIWLQSLP